MVEFLIVEQSRKDIEVLSATRTIDYRILHHAIAEIFPYGSMWPKYTGARSFRFIPLLEDKYLLSYTQILDKKQGDWKGQLHSWGMIGKVEDFLLEENLAGHNPIELFKVRSDLFSVDNRYKTMIGGLEQQTRKSIKLKYSILAKLFLRYQKGSFSWKYEDPVQWSLIENVIFAAFSENIKTIKRLDKIGIFMKPKSFSTLTLSLGESTQIIAMPNANDELPVFKYGNRMVLS